jgi:uncharacterized protein (TIGR00297 family)
VLANGGVATACAVAWGCSHEPRFALAFAGAYAAATADTWGTEIGTLARRRPRSILTLQPIPTGLSGGVTIPGTLGELAGALWLAVAGTLGLALAGTSAQLAPLAIGGIAGATTDSLLGATVQELRRCDRCERTCETDPHACGTPTRLVRGVPGFGNDLVNLLATLAGSAVAFALS